MELTTRVESNIDIGDNTDVVKNPFDAVIARYQAAIAKQLYRKERQNRDFFTVDEQKGLAFYRDAIMSIRAIA